MADDSDADITSLALKSGLGDVAGRMRPATWVLPLITAAVLISAFSLYYFVYVAARREYLANRNFRSLAVLGDQVQAMVTMHSGILEFTAHLADPARDEDHGKKEALEKFVVVRPEDELLAKKERDAEALKDYFLKYLAPGFTLTNQGRAGQSRLEVQRRNGRWELVLKSSGPRSRTCVRKGHPRTRRGNFQTPQKAIKQETLPEFCSILHNRENRRRRQIEQKIGSGD